MFAIFRSMHGRLFLILLVGIIVTASGTVLLSHSRQQELFEQVRTQHLASEITELMDTLEKTPLSERDDFLHAQHGMGIRGRLEHNSSHPGSTRDVVLEEAVHQRRADVNIEAGLAGPRRLRR
jgi:hypothetical protein